VYGGQCGERRGLCAQNARAEDHFAKSKASHDVALVFGKPAFGSN
jgi:hypothetical protein